jgi:hypothetical protein
MRSVQCLCLSVILTPSPINCRFEKHHSIPHDINTMHELWGVSTYRKQNKYLSTGCIMDEVEALPESDAKTELVTIQHRLLKRYDELANKYHSEKGNNENNSLVLG